MTYLLLPFTGRGDPHVQNDPSLSESPLEGPQEYRLSQMFKDIVEDGSKVESPHR